MLNAYLQHQYVLNLNVSLENIRFNFQTSTNVDKRTTFWLKLESAIPRHKENEYISSMTRDLYTTFVFEMTLSFI